jgi:hypothetical protein
LKDGLSAEVILDLRLTPERLYLVMYNNLYEAINDSLGLPPKAEMTPEFIRVLLESPEEELKKMDEEYVEQIG